MGSQELRELPIARRQLEARELVPRHPLQLLMLQACGCALDLSWRELDLEFRPRIGNRHQGFPDLDHCHTQLLSHLATGGVKSALPSFKLSPRELPKTAMPLLERSFADKNPIALHHDSGEDFMHDAELLERLDSLMTDQEIIPAR